MDKDQQVVIDVFKLNQTHYDKYMDKIIHLWEVYCERATPEIKDTALFAGGLEFLANQTFTAPKTTQKATAEKYGVTPQKLSKTYHSIRDHVHELRSSYWREILDEKVHPTPSFPEKADELINKALSTPTFPGNYHTQLTQDQKFLLGDLFSSFYGTSVTGKIELCEEIFHVHPYHPDLYVTLAEFSKQNHVRKKLLAKAVINGENAIEPFIMKDLTGELWMEIDARPYLRAKATFAEQLVREYDFDGAILHYREILRLNEGDNQGIRYLLLPLYLQNNYFSEARDLLDGLDKDTFTIFYEAIYAYLTDGITLKTINLLRKADRHNPHVKDLVLHPKKRPEQVSDYYGVRDESEAAVVVEDTLWAWNMYKDLKQALVNL